MSIISNIGSMAVSGFWKAGAFAMAGLVAVSNAYTGYHWYEAAQARDTAVKERSKAEGERDTANTKLGSCSTALGTQTLAVHVHAAETEAAEGRLALAESKNAEYEKRVASLATIPKSVTCEQAAARIRKTVTDMRNLKDKP